MSARAYLVFVLAMASCALVPMIVGLSATVVRGSSMEPHIVAGDVALSTAFAQTDAVPLGRVISFEAPADSGRTGLILHRIVAIDDDGGLVTAGDGNPDVDSWVLEKSDIIGVAHLLVPWVGLPALWLEQGDAGAFAAWMAATVAALAIEALGARATRPRRPMPRHSRKIALLAITAMALPLGMLSALGTADAAFTGQTSTVGNAWTASTTGPASKLVFSTSPSGSTGGVAFATQPVVTVKNSAGETKTGTRTIALALTTPAGATLACTTDPVVTTTGVAKFTGCAIDKTGTYTLTASSGSLTPGVSASVRITVGTAKHLAFSASPSKSSVSAAFTTQPKVSVTDAGGNLVTTKVAVAIKLTTAAGAKLTCTASSVSTASGIATFSGCRIDKAGTYTLTASSGSLATAVSASFVVSAAPALTCNSTIWVATFSWTPTPHVTTKYNLYVNGVTVPATGADGWNSHVQLMTSNVPASSFPAGTATVEVRQVLGDGTEKIVGTSKVVLGSASYRTYTCS